MSSQEDMFATQEPKKKTKYDFLVLCDKDENTTNPFSLYPTNMFSQKEINEKWLESILDDSSRLKSLHSLQGIPEKKLSLFGKIDEGIIIITIFSTLLIFLFFFLISIHLFTVTLEKFIYLPSLWKNCLCVLLRYITGVYKEQRDAVINSLNDEYKDMRSGGESQINSLKSLALKFPYRLISPKKVIKES